ncbi:hypothetical protein K439DRAFT_119696 [Ramaria rubella]|nr:hypothetical protein K439DRAFT_119696 [Ramaria rubella]
MRFTHDMPPHSKRTTTAPGTMSSTISPRQGSDRGTVPPELVRVASVNTSEQLGAERPGIMLTASPPAVTTFLETNLRRSSAASQWKPSTSSTWSPNLSRKLRWRLQQNSLWETVVFLAFMVATVVFFRALAGIGYVPPSQVPTPLAQSRHTPALGVLRRGTVSMASISGVLDGVLRFTGVRPRAVTDTQGEEFSEEGMNTNSESDMRPRSGRHHFSRVGVHSNAMESIRQISHKIRVRPVPHRLNNEVLSPPVDSSVSLNQRGGAEEIKEGVSLSRQAETEHPVNHADLRVADDG